MNANTWIEQHAAAMTSPKGFEVPIVTLLNGWLEYAETHRDRYGSLIGEDYVLGAAWADMGLALRAMLNGETGRLDCGTLDGMIVRAFAENGSEVEL